MKRESKELRLSGDTSADACGLIVTDLKGDGWELTGTRSEIILTFEREVPEPPSQEELFQTFGIT